MIKLNLRNFYTGLAMISTLAVFQSILLPKWPSASQIPAEKINSFKTNLLASNLVIKSLSSLPKHSDFNISHSPILKFMIGSDSQLFLTNVQVRDRKNMQVTSITESIKPLQLTGSPTISNQPPVFLSESNSQGSSFQTCLVADSTLPFTFEVNADQLNAAVDSIKPLENNLLIKRFLGLKQSREYQCMLITLNTSLPAHEGTTLWLDLLNRLQSTFN